MKIAELVPQTYDFELDFKVIEKQEERKITNRTSGEEYRVMEVLVGDETGMVLMSAWNETIDQLQVGKTYHVTGGKTSLFRGHLRLGASREGTIVESETSIDQIDDSVNVSEKEYERPRKQYGGGAGRSFGNDRFGGRGRRGGRSGGRGGGRRKWSRNDERRY